MFDGRVFTIRSPSWKDSCIRVVRNLHIELHNEKVENFKTKKKKEIRKGLIFIDRRWGVTSRDLLKSQGTNERTDIKGMVELICLFCFYVRRPVVFFPVL